jgi:PAS domain S-box-containing protein
MRLHHTVLSKRQPQGALRFAAIVICFAALTLLATALSARFSAGSLSSILLTLVLIALAVAVGLHIRFLILARREHHETASALDATEREYKSVFDNALDGILILDDGETCLAANAAALKLLGTNHTGVVGQPIKKFFSDDGDFRAAWKQFLARTCEYGETPIFRDDGRTVFVEYTIKANFLPGRHVAVLRDVTPRKQAEAALRESEERFHQMADNIQEIFWMLDAENMKVLYVNPAYEAITGRTCQSLNEDPKSYQDAIHPEDRVRVLSRLEEAAQTGQFDEEFRVVRPDHTMRWVWVRGFPVRDAVGTIRRLVGTAQDITLRKMTEEQMARNLDMAETARAEAEAFRQTSLALTQNLSMDYVLDTLLQSLLKLVPCESAQVILVEAGTRLFLAREAQNCEPNRSLPRTPATLDAQDNRFLMKVLTMRRSFLITEADQEEEWVKLKGFAHLCSWLCVPLIASNEILGVLSLSDTHSQAFTQEHLRLAESLAIPAAVAIQNARLYEQTEIFRAELEQRLADIDQTEKTIGRLRNEIP